MTADLSAPVVTSEMAAPVRRSRLRRLLLGRPEDPRWARPGLWAVLVLATVLYTWGLSANSYANQYYSAAVLSGTHSWKAFFFGAIDAGSFITVDKPPMALWVMGLSARVFGFNTWSLLLPQVVEGVAAVAVLYTAMRRSLGHGAGHAAGLIAAVVLALTPITVAINRDDNPDTLLVLLLVLAGWACLEAIRSGRLRPLLLSALAVGLAFNTKMLQAYLVLPALALVYLFAARGGLGRRLGHLLLAGVVLVVSSAWWMWIVDLMPKGSRPYVGGSANNTVWDLVVGYNGLGRIFGRGVPGGAGEVTEEVATRARAMFGGSSGIGRMFNSIVGGQISWLIAFAVIALVAGLVLRRRRPRTDLPRAALLLWGGWLAIHFVVFSFASGVFHPYYTTAMAPAIAALSGAGGVAMFQAYRRSVRWSWVLPLALAVTGAWAFVMLRRTPSFVPWLAWTVAGMTAAAVIGLLVARLRRGAVRLTVAALVVGLVAVLAGPAAYAVTATSQRVNGSNPLAGPQSVRGSSGMGGPGGERRSGGQFPGGQPGGGPPGGGQPPGGMRDGMRGPGGQVDSKMTKYLVAHQGGARWVVAVQSAMSAAPIILQTGKPVMAMGGFTGSDPALTVEQLQRYIKEGKLHYLIVGGDGPGFGRGGSSAVTSWVQNNCTKVDPSTYGGSSSGQQTLYRCG